MPDTALVKQTPATSNDDNGADAVPKHLNYSGFGYLFRRKRTAIKVTKEGVELVGQACSAHFAQPFIHWQQMDSPAQFAWSWFGSQLLFSVKGQAFQLPMLGYFAGTQCRQQFAIYWARQNQQDLQQLLQRVDQVLAQRYLRRSLLDKIQPRIAREYRRWFPWSECTKLNLSSQLQGLLSKLARYYAWQNSDIEAIQDRYIHQQLTRFQSLFDGVESQPLTAMQRQACVIDEDNNLLLAGAGTGKTSVMVGRAGYLIASGQARGEQILLLAYGHHAAKEMDQRIAAKLAPYMAATGQNCGVKASTFHSLGLGIIAQVEGRKPSLSPLATDESAKQKWLSDTLDELIAKDDVYRKQIFDYFSYYYYVEKNEFEFSCQGDYFAYLNNNDIRSLKGDRVKSFGELTIANWLFSQGIEYCYEAKYQHVVSDVNFRQYQPDFYLPDYGIYIEYYGLDTHGNTAPYIDQAEYLAAIAWKRELHLHYQTPCIELFYHQKQSGQLIETLSKAIMQAAVVTEPLPDDAMLATLAELGRVSELAKLFSQLIGLYKAANLTSQAAVQQVIARSTDPKQTQQALKLLQPLLQAYQQYLAQHEDIDFDDMIAKALRYIETGQYVSPWRYIMVDEFQDISEPRARLVRALQRSQGQASLFCVGDDWQAIYRFSGSDVNLTRHFSDYFGATAKSYLDKTFRFNDRLGHVAQQFVMQNPQQLDKNISSLLKAEQATVSILQAQTQSQAQIQAPLMQALTQISQQLPRAKLAPDQSASVLLLSRYKYNLLTPAQLAPYRQRFAHLTINCQTFHGSKGKEADFVVIMGMTADKQGFPSQKVTPPLLDALLPPAESFAYAEERRLFYVALTRARHHAYIVADEHNLSVFAQELLEQDYDIAKIKVSSEGETTVADTSKQEYEHKAFTKINCIACGSGKLIPKQGQFGGFFSCSHYPLCDHTEQGCEQCHSKSKSHSHSQSKSHSQNYSPMSRSQLPGFQVCLNPDCGHIRPLCQVCGAEMVKRKAVKANKAEQSEFWGCRNYRSQGKDSCRHTVSTDKVAAELTQV